MRRPPPITLTTVAIVPHRLRFPGLKPGANSHAFNRTGNPIHMYNNPTPVIAVGAAGALASTGSSTLWAVLAGFALLAAGTALARIAPRKQL